MKLSIIIVNYNTYNLTKQTIDSIIKDHHDFNYEIILVDNASSDGSINKLQDEYRNIVITQKLRIIINKDNLGFAKANNIGIKFARGKYILLLNSDTMLKENCLEKCLAKMEKDKNIGALGCKVVLANGELDHACKRGFPTPKASLYYFLKLHKKNPSKYGQYNALHLSEDNIGEVDCLTGAFMLMPKSIFDKVGGLDEDFFMYGEDIDLCYKIKELGYKILYYPKAQIIHYKGGSSKKKRSKVIYDFHQAMWIFYKKHYYKKYNFAVTFLVFIGIWLKYLVQIIKNAFK
ncbi:glycosyltransferase family 2 protein [Clostridium sp. YIM B02569]|uniref:glycosyltransferase family 2 protein n=1 Tax=Clostridium sp. YIM B02569 TaxID=2911967 RepID=UPI001EECD836|nr:glycosyltransferase family 2 protein [Clostridium sp. YIM B02569]